MTEKNRTLVVMGIDAEGTPHASWFADPDREKAIRAAASMKFHAVELVEPELQKLAAKLPAGRLSASGKAFCPLVERDLYDKLAVLIGTDAEIGAPEAGSGEGKKAPATAGDPWTTIAVGSIVLATVGRADGWWESVVVAVEPTGDSLTLTWRDWPRMPSFRAPRRSVAVIGPETR